MLLWCYGVRKLWCCDVIKLWWLTMLLQCYDFRFFELSSFFFCDWHSRCTCQMDKRSSNTMMSWRCDTTAGRPEGRHGSVCRKAHADVDPQVSLKAEQFTPGGLQERSGCTQHRTTATAAAADDDAVDAKIDDCGVWGPSSGMSTDLVLIRRHACSFTWTVTCNRRRDLGTSPTITK